MNGEPIINSNPPTANNSTFIINDEKDLENPIIKDLQGGYNVGDIFTKTVTTTYTTPKIYVDDSIANNNFSSESDFKNIITKQEITNKINSSQLNIGDYFLKYRRNNNTEWSDIIKLKSGSYDIVYYQVSGSLSEIDRKDSDGDVNNSDRNVDNGYAVVIREPLISEENGDTGIDNTRITPTVVENSSWNDNNINKSGNSDIKFVEDNEWDTYIIPNRFNQGITPNRPLKSLTLRSRTVENRNIGPQEFVFTNHNIPIIHTGGVSFFQADAWMSESFIASSYSIFNPVWQVNYRDDGTWDKNDVWSSDTAPRARFVKFHVQNYTDIYQ